MSPASSTSPPAARNADTASRSRPVPASAQARLYWARSACAAYRGSSSTRILNRAAASRAGLTASSGTPDSSRHAVWLNSASACPSACSYGGAAAKISAASPAAATASGSLPAAASHADAVDSAVATSARFPPLSRSTSISASVTLSARTPGCPACHGGSAATAPATSGSSRNSWSTALSRSPSCSPGPMAASHSILSSRCTTSDPSATRTRP
ncbi:hypothetical protein ACFSTC_48475 [Nonomuraea ferruginea]